MIILDMDMPRDCGKCKLLMQCKNYCYIENKLPDTCPIKCDIEDIKTEIEDGLNACINIIDNVKNGVYPQIYSNAQMEGRKITYKHCLEIIDKHMKGNNE